MPAAILFLCSRSDPRSDLKSLTATVPHGPFSSILMFRAPESIRPIHPREPRPRSVPAPQKGHEDPLEPEAAQTRTLAPPFAQICVCPDFC